jgi:hypothetical protein
MLFNNLLVIGIRAGSEAGLRSAFEPTCQECANGLSLHGYRPTELLVMECFLQLR